MMCFNKRYLVSTARLSALLDVFSVASLLEGLPGHVLLDVLALLPGGGGALPASGTGAVLLVHILGDAGGDTAANLVGDIVTNLAGSRDVLTHLDISNLNVTQNAGRGSKNITHLSLE